MVFKTICTTGGVIAQRDAYGKALVELGHVDPCVVVLDADVSKSTRSEFFGEVFPDRFFNFGVAEQNMMGAAAGMAACGLIPFVNTFSFLATFRSGEQFRTSVAYPKLNVKIVANYGGLSDSFDGPTHQSIADIAAVRALPNVVVIVPADAVEVEKALPIIADYEGPVWLRLCRNATPVVYGQDFNFDLGKATIVEDGIDVTIISCGTILGRVLQAAEVLRQNDISPRILSVSTLKPIDEKAILDAAHATGAIVTCEEHNILGGLGAAVCEVLSAAYPIPVQRVGVPDSFAESGDYEQLLDKYGLSVEAIISASKRAIDMKSMK
jgi:transketolase